MEGFFSVLGLILKRSTKENLAEPEGDLQNIALPEQVVILVQTGRMKRDKEIKVK